MGKSFADYQAEHLREPFGLPMPDGKPVMVPMASIDEEREIAQAIADAGEEATRFTGLAVLVGSDTAAQVAKAWGQLPPEAWEAAMADMREHFGRKN